METGKEKGVAIGHKKGSHLPVGHPCGPQISAAGDYWLRQFKERAAESYWIDLGDMEPALQCREIDSLYYFGFVSTRGGQVESISGKHFAPSNSAGFQYVGKGLTFNRACAWVKTEAQRLEWLEILDADRREKYPY